MDESLRMEDAHPATAVQVAELAGGPEVLAVQTRQGRWGLAVRGAGSASAEQLLPACIEIWMPRSGVKTHAVGYESLHQTSEGCRARVQIQLAESVSISVNDEWTFRNNVLHLSRH